MNLNIITFSKVSLVRSFLLALFFLLMSASLAFSLSWNDEEWINAGCPQNIFGTWISSEVGIKNKRSLNITNNKFRFLNNHVLVAEYLFRKRDMVKSEKFVEVKLNFSIKNIKKSIYFKIRPHLVYLNNNDGNVNSNTSNCLIKVFEFDTEDNAKFDKYLNWEVYKLKNR